jgi:membrane-associated phospholipid phosphatase
LVIARMPVGWPAAAAAGFVALFASVAGGWAPLHELDLAVTDRARGYGRAHPDWVSIQRVVTDSAQTSVFFAGGLSAALVLLLVRRAYAAAALIVAVFSVVPSLCVIAHAVLHRPRPEDAFVAIASSGFPSGHSSNSAAAALVAVLLIWPRAGRRGRAVTVAVAVVLTLLIGVTRVTLLAHWPSDVLGGWLLVLAVVPPLARVVADLAERRRGR